MRFLGRAVSRSVRLRKARPISRSAHSPHASRRPLFERLEERALLAFNPTAIEQEMFQLVNRFRTNPQQELSQLVTSFNPPRSPDAYIPQQLTYWGVNGTVLTSQFASLTPAPPLAWNEALYNAAHNHNDAMLANDGQMHQFPGEPDPGARITNAGYSWRRWGENIYAYPHTVLEAHGGFVIDWGSGPNGLQDPPNHRLNLLSANFIHIGLAIDDVGTSPARSVGPLLVTQDLAAPAVATSAFVVGAVYNLNNGATRYLPGSGYGNIEIVFEGVAGTYRTTSWSAGGYQVQLPPGTYRGRATGSGLSSPLVSDEFVVGTSNVWIDFVNPRDASRAPQAADDAWVLEQARTSTFDVLRNDRDDDGSLRPATITVVTSPRFGTLGFDPTTGRATYTPTATFIGLDKFTYTVRDNDGLLSNVATVRMVVTNFGDHPWKNPATALDVNVDEIISPLDALQVINALNARGAGRLPVPLTADEMPPPLVDTSGDNFLSPLDALLVINYLNTSRNGNGNGEGEGEASFAQTVVDARRLSVRSTENLTHHDAAYDPELDRALQAVFADWSWHRPSVDSLGTTQHVAQTQSRQHGNRRQTFPYIDLGPASLPIGEDDRNLGESRARLFESPEDLLQTRIALTADGGEIDLSEQGHAQTAEGAAAVSDGQS